MMIYRPANKTALPKPPAEKAIRTAGTAAMIGPITDLTLGSFPEIYNVIVFLDRRHYSQEIIHPFFLGRQIKRQNNDQNKTQESSKDKTGWVEDPGSRANQSRLDIGT